jgi:ABC-type glycerol-3-phosphate transport system permease component
MQATSKKWTLLRDRLETPASRRGRLREALWRVPIYAILILGAIVLGGPFVWVTLSAFMGPDELLTYPPVLIPRAPTLSSFESVFARYQMAQIFWNSLLVAVLTTLGVLVVCAPAAFAFARMKFWGREVLFTLILATMMLPAFALVIPLWTVIRTLGMINTYHGVILPFLTSPFVLFILRQAFSVIPFELDDAARIDGANRFDILIRIVLPLSAPALITASVYTFIQSWNSFLWPLIVLQRQDMWTLPIVLATLSLDFMHYWGETFAACVIFFGPVAIAYAFLQRHFIAGMLRSGFGG